MKNWLLLVLLTVNALMTMALLPLLEKMEWKDFSSSMVSAWFRNSQMGMVNQSVLLTIWDLLPLDVMELAHLKLAVKSGATLLSNVRLV